MNQPYFIVELAHSFHGRLRRVHVPYAALYAVLGLAIVGGCTLLGFASSYLRMTWKVANYNSLRNDINTLRENYRLLQSEARKTNEQLATFQTLATEVSSAYGLTRAFDGGDEAPQHLVPTVRQSLAEYNFLKSANLSKLYRRSLLQPRAETLTSIWPVDGRLTSYFGKRSDPFTGEGAFHTGIDFSAPVGTPVRAAADGIVSDAEFSGRYGRLVVVDHGRGIQTYYAHLSRMDVVAGQEVYKGETLGSVGSSGRATAAHLHYEVRVNGAPMNPYPYLSRGLLSQAPRRSFAF